MDPTLLITVEFINALRFTVLRKLPGGHLDGFRGTAMGAANYCERDGQHAEPQLGKGMALRLFCAEDLAGARWLCTGVWCVHPPRDCRKGLARKLRKTAVFFKDSTELRMTT